ncbi:MAG: N-acetylmuramoyl-L-alanine amidase [Terrimicrobiaceae bacterium]
MGSGLVVCGVRDQRLVVGMLLFGWVLLLVPIVRAQMTDEEKKRLFLQAREDIRPVPRPSPSSAPRPKPQPASTPKNTPEPTPGNTPEPEETPVPHPKKPAPEPAPEQKTPAPNPSETPDIIDVPDLPAREPKKPTPAPESTPVPAISPAQIPQEKTPQGHQLDAPIVVEKSGLEEARGMEPPPKAHFGGFFKRYRYLTPAARKAIDRAKVQRGRWKYIIVHNSGTRQGNARIFDVYHRRVRKMPNGLAYHFVIGNGSSSGNGEIEIGDRWTRQINGGHVASDYLNNIALGICLVGDLNRDKPTPQQLDALDELVTYLRARVGKIKGKAATVKGHKEINPKPTDCPGDRFDLGWLRRRFR